MQLFCNIFLQLLSQEHNYAQLPLTFKLSLLNESKWYTCTCTCTFLMDPERSCALSSAHLSLAFYWGTQVVGFLTWSWCFPTATEILPAEQLRKLSLNFIPWLQPTSFSTYVRHWINNWHLHVHVHVPVTSKAISAEKVVLSLCHRPVQLFFLTCAEVSLFSKIVGVFHAIFNKKRPPFRFSWKIHFFDL